MQACNKQETELIDSIDDGWAVPSESCESLIRSVPAASDFDAAAMDIETLAGGWNLAEGTSEHVSPSYAALPAEFCPAPLEPGRELASELQDEFSKPDLALGTDVEVPPPSGLWFAELRAVVPRPAPAHIATKAMPAKARAGREINIQSCLIPDEAVAPEVASPEVTSFDAASSTEGKKPRWWRRKSRS